MVLRIKDEVRFTHNYRKWYGYPAQGLLLISYPVDIALVCLGTIALVLLTPFMKLGDQRYNKPLSRTLRVSGALG